MKTPATSFADITKCARCPASILFVQMVKKDGTLGKVAPVDVGSTENGNVRVVKTAYGLQGRVLTSDALAHAQSWGPGEGQEITTSHFMTCPSADDFRGFKKFRVPGARA